MNRQEDEDVETYILHPENAINNAKHNELQQSADSYEEKINQGAAGNTIKNYNRFK